MDTSDSQLSKALTHLGDLGYVKTVQVHSEQARRFTATRAGAHAFRVHARALQALTAHVLSEEGTGGGQD